MSAGSFGKAGGSGKTAQEISYASFATLSLIYSFTEVLNLSDSLATLFGLTARVSVIQKVHNIKYSAFRTQISISAQHVLNATSQRVDPISYADGQNRMAVASIITSSFKSKQKHGI